MTVGIELNNPFDLEVNQSFKWNGEIRPSAKPPFCQFDTLLDGVRAGLKDLRNQQTIHGLNNWTDIITKYAPPSQNDTTAYIMAICKGTGTYPKDYINLSDPTFLALAGKCVMIQEQGYNPCTDELLTQAVNEVLGITPRRRRNNMSLANLLGDIFTGNFTNAEARIKNWWSGVSPSIQAFITTVETGEGVILQSLVSVAAKDVLAGGFTTASFVAAIKDVGAQLLAKNVTMANTVITAALNAEVTAQASAAGMTVPTNAGPAVVAPVVVPASPVS